ncbi:MAG TPA: hypothetical protein DGK91_01570 [Clostridium sp.]|jgi:hypothetical protein|nr:hypothetical protein [Clostridia bacterium]HCW03325.1 hypothetical protein [Clostridium sp.]
MPRLLAIIIFIILLSTFITYGLNRLFKKKKFVKYLPSLISFIIMLNSIITASRNKGEGFSDLAAIIIAMMCFAGSLSGLVTALYIDFIYFKMRGK